MATIETFRGAAHPWLCDVMGHLNTRNYVAMFDDASMHLISALGYDFADARAGKFGWADVHAEIDLLAEVGTGELVKVVSCIPKLGNSSLTSQHEMKNVTGERVFARYTLKTVFFDLQARKSHTIPEIYRSAAAELAPAN
ncbi:MAG: acyl-CoA thioesterase [Pseudomonadota bacterium]